MPSCLYQQMSGREPVKLNFTEELKKEWNNSAMTILKSRLPVNTASLDQTDLVHVQGNVAYFGKSTVIPEIGDVKVTFTMTRPGQVSLIAQVYQDNLQEFTAKNGKKFCTLTMGAVDMDSMFTSEHNKNSALTWILRIAGFLLVVFGLKSLFEILVTLFKVLPFLASIVNFGVGAVCWIVGAVWSIAVIGIAWIFYRPVLGVSLLVAAGVIVGYFAMKGKKLPAPEGVS